MEPQVQQTIDALISRVAALESHTEDVRDAISAADLALTSAALETREIYAAIGRLTEQVDKLVQPAPPVADPNAMPTDPLPGWALRMADDFADNVPLGGAKAFFERKGWAFYDGPATSLRDTSRKGTYDTALAVSVQNGVLTSRYGFKGSVPFGSAMLPLGWGGQTYGRFAVRFRVDQVTQRKIAWLLWPANNNWNDGEIDFPEAGAGGNIWGFNHRIGNPSQNQMSVDTGVKTTDWHTAVIEWLPNRLTFLLDGKVVKETTDSAAIPRVPMRWVLQSETSLNSTPVPTNSIGNVEIAWLTAHTRA